MGIDSVSGGFFSIIIMHDPFRISGFKPNAVVFLRFPLLCWNKVFVILLVLQFLVILNNSLLGCSGWHLLQLER